MENIALNVLPVLQGNGPTMGLLMNTAVEVYYRLIEKNIPALAIDVVSAAIFGSATAVLLPEFGIGTLLLRN